MTSEWKQNCIHQVTSDKSSAGQEWTVAQSVLWVALNVVNHNNIYPHLIVSTSNVSPCVPSRGYVDFSAQLYGHWGDCVHCLNERADNIRTPVWQMVGLTFCGSVSGKQRCQCQCHHIKAWGCIDGALTSVVTWPRAVMSCQIQNVRWLKAPDSFNMCSVHPKQIMLQAHNAVLMCKLKLGLGIFSVVLVKNISVLCFPSHSSEWRTSSGTLSLAPLRPYLPPARNSMNA